MKILCNINPSYEEITIINVIRSVSSNSKMSIFAFNTLWTFLLQLIVKQTNPTCYNENKPNTNVLYKGN